MEQKKAPSYKVALWGFGNMNKVILRYVLEKGHKVVAVIGHHNQGKDAGEVAGLKTGNVGVNIADEKEAEKVIKQTKPDACVLATRSSMKDIAPAVRLLGENGVNTITIGEEAFYAWNTAPALSQEFDKIFKKGKCTFTGTGYQDVFWGYLATTLVGCTHKIDRMECFTQYNVDDYGRALCEAHGAGLTQEAFAKTITNNKDAAPAYVWNSNEWICARMGWKVKKTIQQLLPTISDQSIPSKSFGATIPAGSATGMKAVVTTETEDGIVIESIMIGQVYHGDMVDVCVWNMKGEPNTELTIKRPATIEITCATVVNRLQQVIEGPNGYVPTDQLGPISWRYH